MVEINAPIGRLELRRNGSFADQKCGIRLECRHR